MMLSLFNLFRKQKDRRKSTIEYRRLYSRIMAQDVLMSLPYIGLWVKNSKFELMEISDQASKILYNRKSNQCVGLTDYTIAKECGMKVSEEQFANICRASDLYLIGDKPKTFIEFIFDTDGHRHIWKTIKSQVCIDGEFYYFGFAIFLDVMLGGYDEALNAFENENNALEQINDNLYVYK